MCMVGSREYYIYQRSNSDIHKHVRADNNVTGNLVTGKLSERLICIRHVRPTTGTSYYQYIYSNFTDCDQMKIVYIIRARQLARMHVHATSDRITCMHGVIKLVKTPKVDQAGPASLSDKQLSPTNRSPNLQNPKGTVLSHATLLNQIQRYNLISTAMCMDMSTVCL